MESSKLLSLLAYDQQHSNQTLDRDRSRLDLNRSPFREDVGEYETYNCKTEPIESGHEDCRAVEMGILPELI
jgi:hypothetical protein